MTGNQQARRPFFFHSQNISRTLKKGFSIEGWLDDSIEWRFVVRSHFLKHSRKASWSDHRRSKMKNILPYSARQAKRSISRTYRRLLTCLVLFPSRVRRCCHLEPPAQLQLQLRLHLQLWGAANGSFEYWCLASLRPWFSLRFSAPISLVACLRSIHQRHYRL